MSERDSRSEVRAPVWLYPGLALFVVLAILAVVSVRREWQRRIEQARAEALYELVAQRAPLRPTDTPGLSAWLAAELRHFAGRNPERDTVEPPLETRRVREALGAAAAEPAPGATLAVLAARELDPSSDESALLFRRQRFVVAGEETLVLTERASSVDSAPFLAVASERLLRARDGLWRRPMAGSERDGVRLVRLYAVSPEGSLLSLPWSDPTRTAGERLAAALAEGREFRKFPRLPNFVPFEAVFRFDFGPDTEADSRWTGAYLDLGGQGMVGTLLVPLEERGVRAVLAADFRFDIDWQAFAAGLEAPLVAATVGLDRGTASWRPWETFAASLSERPEGEVAAALLTAVRDLARRGGAEEEPSFLYHGVAESADAVAAFQVTERQWLIVLFPRARSAVALLPAVLVALLALALLAGFEISRRDAEKARRKAESEWREKQNLLDSMQVPLTVVDPNSDRIVHANRAAQELGILAGLRFADLVTPSGRERYARMQRFEGLRRAYGTPLELKNPADPEAPPAERYVVVRSVAVTAPIESLEADERHRLGVLFVIEPDDDLGPLLAETAATARDDERRRLAGLLSHGVDTLARVLAGVVAEEVSESASPRRDDAELVVWLAEYLERRVRTVGFLLEHWSREEPLPGEAAIDVQGARATLDRLRAVCQRVRDDAELRSRLLWSNGTLAARSADGEVLSLAIDWPRGLLLSCPQPGGFGFFLGEAVGNAVRHGAPGSVPRVEIRHDAVRRELRFTVENEVATPTGEAPIGATYGGRSLLFRLTSLFGWRDLRWSIAGSVYRLEWSTPVARVLPPGEAD
jgi:hypothetical protein